MIRLFLKNLCAFFIFLSIISIFLFIIKLLLKIHVIFTILVTVFGSCLFLTYCEIDVMDGFKK